MDDEDRRKRREDEEKKQRTLLYLLGFACLIQLFVSLQGSREIAGRWQAQRTEESRNFDKKVREEGGGAPARGDQP